MSGLRVELAIDSPRNCPVAAASDTAGEPASDATWSQAGDRTVEQFELSNASAAPEGAEAVFEHEGGTVYEFERDGTDCACEQIEAAGLPVADVRGEDGGLRVTLHVDDQTELSDVLGGVREVADEVSIQSIARSDPEADASDLVLVDRGRLTERQREVVQTARLMGYYEYPRGANASEVADALDICPSTLAEHLAAAQTKLLDEAFGDPA